MRTYTWEEIVEITKNAGGKTYSSPFGDYKGRTFELKEISIKDIPSDYYLTLNQCRELDLDEDEIVIKRLMKEYEKSEPIPPVILNDKLEVIDGSHRIGSQYELGRKVILAFVLIN